MLTVLAATLSREPGGTDHSLRNLIGPLRDRDVDVAVAGPGGTPSERWWKREGVDFRAIAFPPRSGFRDPSDGRRTAVTEVARQVPRTARAVRLLASAARGYDVLHSNWLFSHVDAAVAGRVAGRPVVVELHDIVPPGVGRRVLGGAVILSGRAVAVSRAVQAQLGPRARADTTVIHQAVDVDRFSPGPGDRVLRVRLSGGHPERFLVAVVGRIDPGKRVGLAVDAVAAARERGVDAHLTVVGATGTSSSAHLDDVRAHAQRRLPGRHTFAGSTDDVVTTIRSVDTVVVPSMDEPFGLIALEAQAVGTPVVVADSGGLPEFVRDGLTGLVRPGHPAAFAEALVRLDHEDGLRSALAKAARAATIEEFSITRRADRMAEMYRDLAGVGA